MAGAELVGLSGLDELDVERLVLVEVCQLQPHWRCWEECGPDIDALNRCARSILDAIADAGFQFAKAARP